MANLIMDEVKKNGRVKIRETEYAVPTKVAEVIKKYSDFVRAGSVGPDFFPDLITGQMDIHPKDSGEILKLMWNVLTTMKEGVDYDQAFAFYLGYTLHYACDMFSHYYINEYAGGFFPAIEDIASFKFPIIEIDKQKLSIILKHITIETYLDQKVKNQNFSMEIPSKYLMRCFGTIEAWENIGKIVPQSNYELLRIMVDDYSKALKSDKNIDSRKSQELQERIITWMKEWEKFAKDSVSGNKHNFDKILDIIRKTPTDDGTIKLAQFLIFLYQVEQSPLPTIIDILKGSYLNPLTWVEKGAELAFYKSVLKALYEQDGEKKDTPNTIKGCKEELHDLIFKYATKPETILDKSLLFESLRKQKNCAKLTDYFNNEWGNFGELIDCQSQTFNVFRHCLNMGKLCLVGNENLIKIGEQYNAKDCSSIFKDGVLKHYVSKISVSIKIANIAGAGTNNDVHLTIFQKCGKSHKYYLDSKSNDFRVGKEYSYTINLVEKVDLNDFDLFTLGCDFTSFTSKLVIEKMVITDNDFGDTLVELKNITIQRGKPGTGSSGNSEVPSVYKLKIHGHNFKGGTRGRAVWFTVKDKQGGSSRYRLNHKGDVFPLKEGDDFEISLNGSKKVEDLKAFEISCDYSTNAPELGLKNVEVLDVIKNITLAAPSGEYTIKKNKPLVISVNASELLKKYK